jgi:DNA repair exonuclease SbcCD ATPase subunit
MVQASTEVNSGDRRARDLELHRVALLLENQAVDIENLRDELKKFNELTNSINLLNQAILNLQEKEKQYQAMITTVAIQRFTLSALGVIIISCLPLLAAWNVSLNSELRELKSFADISGEKIKNLETRINAKP